MRKIAVINQKGGVGKTTTTANLGAAMARAGKRVLLIDFDPQGHLTLHYGAEVAPDQPSVYDVLTASIPISDVALSVRENVTLVPADVDLAGVETELVSVTGREVLLREALDLFEGSYDVMLIDCPPSLGILTINALVAAEEVLIPLQAHFFGLQGLSKLLETVTLVRQRINPNLKVTGIALCMHESATRLAGEVVEDLQNFLESSRGTSNAWANARICKTSIRRNIKLAESCSFGQTVFDYAPKSNGAVDYTRLATEILEDIIITPVASTEAPTRDATEAKARPKTKTDAVEVPSVAQTSHARKASRATEALREAKVASAVEAAGTVDTPESARSDAAAASA